MASKPCVERPTSALCCFPPKADSIQGVRVVCAQKERDTHRVREKKRASRPVYKRARLRDSSNRQTCRVYLQGYFQKKKVSFRPSHPIPPHVREYENVRAERTHLPLGSAARLAVPKVKFRIPSIRGATTTTSPIF